MLVLPSELTHSKARACSHMLATALASKEADAATVEVDASALVKFDSSALAVLLECAREASLKGKAFSVKNLPERLRELAKLYGVDVLLAAKTPPKLAS